MCQPPLRMLGPLLVLLVLTACSSQLKMTNSADTDYVVKLRAEYFAAHPDGEFNEYIERGEVVKGMDFLAVLAAWGHPQSRHRSRSTTELWTYRDIDEEVGNWVEYRFNFHNNVLDDWDISRHFADGSVIDVAPSRPDVTLSRPAGSPPVKR